MSGISPAPNEDPTIKRITLTSSMPSIGASAEPEPAPSNRTRRKNRKNVRGPSIDSAAKVIVTKDMGSVVPASTITTSTQSAGAATSPGTFVQLASTHVPGSNSSKATGATAPLTATGAPISGGANVKVVLTQSRKKKVLLAAPKKAHSDSGSNKRKTAKKIYVNLKGLGSGLRRAKTIRKRASKHTLEDIKKGLVEAKLIKADSKAPEEILRQMYADYMVLKKKAL